MRGKLIHIGLLVLLGLWSAKAGAASPPSGWSAGDRAWELEVWDTDRLGTVSRAVFEIESRKYNRMVEADRDLQNAELKTRVPQEYNEGRQSTRSAR